MVCSSSVCFNSSTILNSGRQTSEIVGQRLVAHYDVVVNVQNRTGSQILSRSRNKGFNVTDICVESHRPQITVDPIYGSIDNR